MFPEVILVFKLFTNSESKIRTIGMFPPSISLARVLRVLVLRCKNQRRTTPQNLIRPIRLWIQMQMIQLYILCLTFLFRSFRIVMISLKS